MDEELAGRIEALSDEGKLNYESAKVLAEEFGVKPRSIVTFATRKGLAYHKKVKAFRTSFPTTKESMVFDISLKLKIDPSNLTGLVSASKSALTALYDAIVTKK